ncbi:hypothetical protein PF006_g5341 [Phytophthora fragariae]|uniref:Uncharacterized protein n=1 Tax=Phytophthora fragariae TaxID=53985 RepID=A0A6A3UJB1_9STRA|nr:hypothetical protein PF003_g37501 [Phytophthora fragariae]KAE9150251.1 hypothetical protein PF006_g5341 [Phytophthora fragariae]
MEVVDGAVKQSAEMDDDLATLSNTTTVQTIVTGEEGEVRVAGRTKSGTMGECRPLYPKSVSTRH